MIFRNIKEIETQVNFKQTSDENPIFMIIDHMNKFQMNKKQVTS